MKCKFCDKLCLALNDRGNSPNLEYFGSWICTNHPSSVKYNGIKSKFYCICTFYKNHWYQFEYRHLEDYYVLYCLDDHKMPDYETGEEKQMVNYVLMRDIPPFKNITPENAASKLQAILVFS